MNFCNRGYCTCFFDKLGKWVLTPCCKLHDFNYDKQHITRWESDKRIFKCVKRIKAKTSKKIVKHLNTFALSFLGGAMWLGIRLVGWHFWNKAKKESKKMAKSNAILHKDELEAHFDDESNHYLYQKRDDNTLTAWMCCEFEVVDGNEVLIKGGCGEGLCYDLNRKQITIEKV